MAVLPIVTGADTPVLRAKTKPVSQVTKEIKKLIKDMGETMISAEGIGIAAPQIGKSLRLCLAHINGKTTPLINPKITWRNDEFSSMAEGCLSLPGVEIDVKRPTEIHLTYTDEDGNQQERKFSGMDARVIQHEVDHLEGVLIVDYN